MNKTKGFIVSNKTDMGSDRKAGGCFSMFLFFLAPACLTTNAVQKIPSLVWKKYSSNTFAPCSAIMESRSVTECGAECSGYRGCDAFCFNDVTLTCYVIAMTTLQNCPVPDDVELTTSCYGMCPHANFSLVDDRCLSFFKDEKNYYDAREECEKRNSHLYHVKTLDDKQTLIEIMAINGYMGYINTPGKVWVGADDLAREGDFVWSDGTPLPLDSPLWRDNNPDNYMGKENCVYYKDTDGMLNDAGCLAPQVFVCQVDTIV